MKRACVEVPTLVPEVPTAPDRRVTAKLVGFTKRTTWLPVSLTAIVPLSSTSMPPGELKVPGATIVVTVPLERATRLSAPPNSVT